MTSAALALTLACLLSQDAAPVVPESSDESKARAAEFLALASEAARGYEIRVGDEPGVPLDLRPEPLLNWSNPVVGELYGGVFLWTHQGRPEAVASIFKWYSPYTHRTHEFQSLATRPINATRDGETVWTSEEPGVESVPVPDAPRPASSPIQRLSQMRRIAQRFTASKTNKEKVRRELRLLPQPLYRYEVSPDAGADGGLFVFVEGTDPEIVLLVEQVSTDAGSRWTYALARLNFEALNVSLDGEEVWSVEQLLSRDIYSGLRSYTKFQIDPVR